MNVADGKRVDAEQAARLPHGNLIPSLWRLAGLQLRQTGRLLSVLGLGLMLVVLLVSVMPLFADIAMTAGLRAYLKQDPRNFDVTVATTSQYMPTADYQTLNQDIGAISQQTIQPYLTAPPVTVYQMQTAYVYLPDATGTLQRARLADFVMDGLTTAQMPSLVHVIDGRLPQPTAGNLEVALRQDNATALHLSVGSVLQLRIADTRDISNTRDIQVDVVGIIAENDLDNAIWKDYSLAPFDPNDFNIPSLPISYKGIVAQSALTAMLTQLSGQSSYSAPGDIAFEQTAQLGWYYRVDPAKLDGTRLDQIADQFNTFAVRVPQLSTNLNLGGITDSSKLFDPGGALSAYSAHITDAQIPVTVLIIGIMGVALFFVSLLADLLIERQIPVIAHLRSRGFSARQIFLALMLQGLGMCVVALVVGLALAPVAAQALAAWRLPGYAQAGAFPSSLVIWYGLGTAVVAFLAFLLAIARAIRLDVLALRRESARASRPLLWQRLNLDVIAVIIGLFGFATVEYISATVTGIDPQIDRLLAPLTVIAPVFLMIAALLLCLRVCIALLQWGAKVVARRRGAAAMLALAQLARAPGQALRMAILLTLAIEFSVFTFAFTASQTQRAGDIATQETGADFSGNLVPQTFPGLSPEGQQLVQAVTQRFEGVPGVVSASVGSASVMGAADTSLHTKFSLIAVDPATYAQTARWAPQDAQQSTQALMAELTAARPDAINRGVIPAVVDATTWKTFHLTKGATFTLSPVDYGAVDSFRFVAIDEVEAIPSAAAGQGGVLADLWAYSNYYQSTQLGFPLFNAVWLRTKQDAASLAQVRATLDQGKLLQTPYSDRAAIAAALNQEPLAETLLGLLGVSVALPLILALVGMLTAAQLQMRRQLTGFALLRAIGATARQVTAVLLWEQGVIYLAGIVLGGVLGAFLTYTLMPNLIFTSVTAGSDPSASIYLLSGAQPPVGATLNFALLQQSPPVRTIMPPIALLTLGGVVVLGALALGVMTRVIARTSFAQTLRLNED